MSELEDRILKIVELRASGLDEEAIARKLGIDAAVLEMYVDSTRKAIQQATVDGYSGLERIARRIGISSIVLGMFSSCYEIKIPEILEGKEKYIEKIKNAVSQGLDSITKIAKETGLSTKTVVDYASMADIDLPRVSEIGGRRRKPRGERARKIGLIKLAVDEGINNFKEIADRVGLAVSTVKLYVGQAGIGSELFRENRERRRKEMQEREVKRIEEIRKSIEDGAKSVREISTKLNVSTQLIYRYAKLDEIDLPKGQPGKPKIEFDETALRQALSENVNSLEELCKIAGFRRPSGLRNYCEEHGIILPDDLVPWKTWPEADVLIERGFTLRQIGSAVGVTFERARQYIFSSGQYREWANKRKEVKNRPKIEEKKRKQLEGGFLSIVRSRTEELAKKEGWTVEKAVEYLHKYKGRHRQNYSFDLLYKLFKNYENAKTNGKKLSFRELGSRVDIYATKVNSIFDKVGIEPMYGGREQQSHIDKKGKYTAATKRGFELPLPAPDIDYFLGVIDSGLCFNRFHAMGKRPKFDIINMKVGYDKLTYRLVSEIYEAIDCKTKEGKFSEDEIAELVGVSRKVVDLALMERNTYEPFLIECLQDLYNDKNVKTPYVTKRMREKLEREG